ncbi:hypothetical protein A2U01_0065706, partial [Trifolium medium]|nr:hypothetical protein [Trifolium medium]
PQIKEKKGCLCDIQQIPFVPHAPSSNEHRRPPFPTSLTHQFPQFVDSVQFVDLI